MKNSDSHYYLYAKKWYKRSEDIVADLRVIHGRWCGMDPSHVDTSDIVHKLLSLVWAHIAFAGSPEFSGKFIDFVTGIAPENTWEFGYMHNRCNWISGAEREKLGVYSYTVAVIYKCLSVLRLASVSSIPGGVLDEPDYTLLPPNDSSSLDLGEG